MPVAILGRASTDRVVTALVFDMVVFFGRKLKVGREDGDGDGDVDLDVGKLSFFIIVALEFTQQT